MNKTFIILAAILILSACKHTEESTLAETKDSMNNSETKICSKDARICPDGRAVGRDPNNNCEFFSCDNAVPAKPNPKDPHPDRQVMCTADAKQCADGSWVGRDPKNNCEFKSCPDGREPRKKEM